MKNGRIKGGKNKNPILRVRKSIPKPGTVMGTGKRYTKKNRKTSKNEIREIAPIDPNGVVFEDDDDIVY